MRRRDFLSLSAGFATSVAMRSLCSAVEADPTVKITRILAFDLPSKRVKRVGKNSRPAVHGDSSRDPIVRLYTSKGTDGFGHCRLDEKKLTTLLGKNPADCLQLMAAQTTPLWDLLGKLANKPAYQLF